MDWLLIITGGVLAISSFVTIVGLTIHDLRIAQLDNELAKKPYALKFRRRPLVSIIVDDEPTDESIKSIRHGNYRKVEIIYYGENIHGDLMLPIDANTVLDRTTLSKAINQFNIDPKTEAVEIIPRPDIPENIRELLQFYRRIVKAPFIAVRAAFHVVPTWGSGWPIIINPRIPVSKWRVRIYAFLRWLGYLANTIALVSVFYFALFRHHPEFLFIYIGIFFIWMITSIWLYPHFSLRQKIVSIILAPVSFGYFLIIALLGPIVALHHPTNDAFARLWRSSHQH